MAYTTPKTWSYKESLSSNDLNTYVRDNILAMDDRFYPVGTVYISVVSTNPATLLGFGTWERIAEGKMLVGLDSSDTDFDTVEETGGSKTKDISHTHTYSNTTSSDGAHTHTYSGTTSAASNTYYSNAGDENVPTPYYTHTHTFSGTTSSNGAHTHTSSGTTAVGGSGTQDVMNPYYVVYIWKRTA